jgi:tetratricopeptide (TPR) repeat protein
MIRLILVLIFTLSLSLIATQTTFAQTEKDAEMLFNQAKDHVILGEYKQAIAIYDDILEMHPNNISTLRMKGIIQGNLQIHDNSLKQFFKVLQTKPNDVISLVGMGVGFGNLGEYSESKKYFEKALKEKPNNTIIKNYKEFTDKIISKYPYTPTIKPDGLEKRYTTTIPEWTKTIAKWWADDAINDEEFISILTYFAEQNMIQIPPVEKNNESDKQIPKWIKDNAGWWADDAINDEEFIFAIQYLFENEIIQITTLVTTTQKSPEELDREIYLFSKYLRDVSNNISKEKRYIEYSNPSQDVIKKFLRDYAKWNFEDEIKNISGKFPDPTYKIDDEIYTVYYKIFVNEQPTGLPLDHVSTLANSFVFWENQELNTDNQKVKMKFEITNQKYDANVWVTWVVRDLGEGVLGHATLGKGIVEVTLGDYNCDGSFQLYDVKSIETIMTHELGHSIGLKHVEDKSNIMYPSYHPSYGYCLIN